MSGSTRRRLGLRCGLGVTLAAVGAGCRGSAPDDRPLPPSVPSVAVSFRDYRIEHGMQFPPGRIVLDVRNADAVNHSVSLVRLSAEQQGPIQDIVAKPAIYATVVILNPEPGRQILLGQDLVPGRYAFICFAKAPDGVAHYLKGMVSDFTV